MVKNLSKTEQLNSYADRPDADDDATPTIQPATNAFIQKIQKTNTTPASTSSNTISEQIRTDTFDEKNKDTRDNK